MIRCESRCGADEVHCGKPASESEVLCVFRMSDSEDSDLEEGQDVMRHQTKIVSMIQVKRPSHDPLCFSHDPLCSPAGLSGPVPVHSHRAAG